MKIFMAKKNELKLLRRKLGLSQSQMAIRLGVDQATVSKIEAGRLKPSKTLSLLIGFIAWQAADALPTFARMTRYESL